MNPLRAVLWFLAAVAVLGWPALVLAQDAAPQAKGGALGICVWSNADGVPATANTPAKPATCRLVLQPDIIKPLAVVNLATGKLTAGIDSIAVGACFGATYQPGRFYASGLDFCFNATGGATPTILFPSAMLHALTYGSIGLGPLCTAGAAGGGFGCQWLLLLSGNFAIGL